MATPGWMSEQRLYMSIISFISFSFSSGLTSRSHFGITIRECARGFVSVFKDRTDSQGFWLPLILLISLWHHTQTQTHCLSSEIQVQENCGGKTSLKEKLKITCSHFFLCWWNLLFGVLDNICIKLSSSEQKLLGLIEISGHKSKLRRL